MKKLLLAGGSHSDIPMIQAAKRMGFFVITSGNRADDQGHQLSDQVCLADFSDREALLEVARRLDIDYICPSSNDFSMISSAYVAEQLGLPGFDSYETTLLLHHKDRFRQFAAHSGLPCPRAIAFDMNTDIRVIQTELAGLQWPLIVKPIDLTGGKGVSKVDAEYGLETAVNKAFAISRAKRIVVEEFFTGTLHSYSCFLKAGRVAFAYHDQEFSYLNPYLVSTSAGPSQLSAHTLSALKKVIEEMANSLDLTDGLLHAQFLANQEKFRIIEFTRRCPGDFYAWPVNQSTGIDYAATLLRPLLGMPLGDLSGFQPHGYVSRHCVMAAQNGWISSLEIAPEIAGNIAAEWILKPVGGKIEHYLSEKERIFFLKYSQADEMLAKTSRIHELIQLKIKGTDD